MSEIAESLYVKSEIHRNILLRIEEVGDNLKSTLENKIKYSFEGKCCAEGIIKEDSSKIITYSSGKINSNGNISFDIIIECLICNPVLGMIIPCTIQSITKAGINAESSIEIPSPIKVFVSREYVVSGSSNFSEYEVGSKINIRVIGQRYQLQDSMIYIIGDIHKEKHYSDKKQEHTGYRQYIKNG